MLGNYLPGRGCEQLDVVWKGQVLDGGHLAYKALWVLVGIVMRIPLSFGGLGPAQASPDSS